MRALLAAVFCLAATGAAAMNEGDLRLQGEWRVTIAQNAAYRATILVDAEGRMALEATNVVNGKPASFKTLGYAKVEGRRVEFVETARNPQDRIAVVRTVCAIQSPDLLHCTSIFADGRVGFPAVVTRVGPGPASLIPVSR